MFELKNIGRSMELPIGTSFYYSGRLCEVFECTHCMIICVLYTEDYESCKMFAREKSKRKDGTEEA